MTLYDPMTLTIINAYRDNTAISNLEREGIKVFYIARFDEILSYLNPVLTEQEKRIIENEISI
ncbi:MAG: hypothetical protein Q8M03_16845 [Legionella sp.]|nr:hypothetical protein [Legionella sp.]